MTTPTFDQTRQALLTWLKDKVADAETALSTTIDTKELEWQGVGKAGALPCVRYGVEFEPDPCGWLITVIIDAWSEGDSSRQAVQIIDSVVAGLHRKAYHDATVRLQVCELLRSPRVLRADDRLWRAEARFTARAGGA